MIKFKWIFQLSLLTATVAVSQIQSSFAKGAHHTKSSAVAPGHVYLDLNGDGVPDLLFQHKVDADFHVGAAKASMPQRDGDRGSRRSYGVLKNSLKTVIPVERLPPPSAPRESHQSSAL